MNHLRAFWILFLVAGLCGCAGDLKPPASERMKTYIKTQYGVTLIGLHGYCVDPKSYRRSEIGEHVVFGNCASLGRDASLPEPQKPALLVVSVTHPNRLDLKANAERLSQFARTKEGSVLVMRAGRNNRAVVSGSFSSDGLYGLYIKETAPPAGLQKSYWRGFMGVRGSIVALSVQGVAHKPLTSDEGLELLRKFAQTILNANDDGKGNVTEFIEVNTRAPDPRPVLNAKDDEKGNVGEFMEVNTRTPAPRPVNEEGETIFSIGILRRLF